MFRILYSILGYVAIPLILLRLLWKSRKIPAYRQRWAERFGLFAIPKNKQNGIWLHAVSLGELIAAIPLINALLKQYPDLPITITNMTVTGSARVQKEFGDKVFHVYVPYDLPSVVKRFLNKVQPKIVIILETELWPNILHYCGKENIPVIIANARLSEKSMRGYQHIAGITRAMLQNVSILAAHAYADADRFVALGLPRERAVVTGSIKFEITNALDIFEKAAALRATFGDRPVWIAASTHETEEEKILQAFAQVLKKIPNLLLILVPRHPERFSAVKELCIKQGYRVVTRSSHESCNAQTQVYLGDTMGELKILYAASDVAFVAGSFKAIGGHNVLEPIGLNIPTITGPHMFNFAEINEMLLKADALVQVPDEKMLVSVVIELLTNSAKRETLQSNGEKVLSQNRGALQKNLDLVSKVLKT